MSRYFKRFFAPTKKFLFTLTEGYKRKGRSPLITASILSSYYTDKRDKEIAALASLLVKEDSFEYVQALRNMLGQSPWKWFEQRLFVSLSFGDTQTKKTAGVWNWRIAAMFDKLWEYFYNINTTFYDIEHFVKYTALANHCSLYDAFFYIGISDFIKKDVLHKLRLLLMILGSCDEIGIGTNLWSIEPPELKCPITKEVRDFARLWFPDFKRAGCIDDVVQWCGFVPESDFYYAMLAFEELKKDNVVKCSKLTSKYYTWYMDGEEKTDKVWSSLFPPIPF